MREVLCGEELPAQWQKYPLRTQQELMRGRDSLKDYALWRWADEGEKWLREQFAGKELGFYTSANIDDHTIRLHVYRQPVKGAAEIVFEVTEPAVSFVSHTTLTKIILIAG